MAYSLKFWFKKQINKNKEGQIPTTKECNSTSSQMTENLHKTPLSRPPLFYTPLFQIVKNI